jgi:homocysteine S-methyltransferase
LIAASIGTYGAHLSDGSEYSGNYGKSVKELVEWHLPKFSILADSGADILACETVPCIDEVKAFQQLLTSTHYEADLSSTWISMSCKSSSELNSGETLEDALRAIEDPSFEQDSEKLKRKFGVGINCTSPMYTADLLDIISNCCNKSRIVAAYPNSGEQWDGVKKDWHLTETGAARREEFDDSAVEMWRDRGAVVIGGCCRCTPATIAGIRRTLVAAGLKRSSL